MTFSVPARVRSVVFALAVALPLVVLSALLINGYSLVEAAIFVIPVAALLFLVGIDLSRSSVELDGERITEHRLLGSVTLRWLDVDDYVSGERLISIASDSLGVTLKFFHAEYGMSLEPFDELRGEILRQVGPRLNRAWNDMKLPVTFQYPGLSGGAVVGYTAALCFALLFPVLISIRLEGYWPEKVLFVMLCLAPIVPFLARDWARTQDDLVVEQRGLRRKRQSVFIGWSEIEKIVVREPGQVGFGSVRIEASDQRRIWIPRRLRGFGGAWHLIKQHTNAPEEHGYDF